MKKFEFRLDSALRWRNTQSQLERAKLQTLLGEQARLTRDLETLKQERLATVRALQQMALLDPADLRALASYQVGSDLRAQQLKEQLAKRNVLVDKQRARVNEAEIDVRLLAKLKEKKQSEWKFQFDKELESHAAEAWLAAHFGSRSD